MKLNIDKANLINIFREDQHPLQKDAIRAMKLQLDLKFNFSKTEAAQDDILSMLLLDFNVGVGAEVIQEFQEEGSASFELTDNLHTTYPDKQALFLLDKPAEEIKLCKDNGGLLVFGKGEEFELFKKLFVSEPDNDFHNALRIGPPNFTSWTCLNTFALPFTDFILVDNYILNDQSVIEDNLLKILSCLHEGKKVETNIVIFTDKDKLPKDFTGLKNKIISAIRSKTGKKSNVTFCTMEIHSRPDKICRT